MRTFAAKRSRRGLHSAVMGLIATGVVNPPSQFVVEAKKHKKKCKGGKSKCGRACVDRRRDPSNCGGCGVACPTGGACNNGVCECPGRVSCGATCVDLKTDAANCGTCGRACAAGKVCVEGLCWTPCPVPSGTCGSAVPCSGTGICVSLSGANVCAASVICNMATDCTGNRAACPEGFACVDICCDPFPIPLPPYDSTCLQPA
jgi:hypothetical protein